MNTFQTDSKSVSSFPMCHSSHKIVRHTSKLDRKWNKPKQKALRSFYQNLQTVLAWQPLHSTEIKTEQILHSVHEPRESFSQRSQTFGIGQANWAEFLGAFGVFLALLSSLLWHCESLVYGKIYQIVFPTIKFDFRPNAYKSKI